MVTEPRNLHGLRGLETVLTGSFGYSRASLGAPLLSVASREVKPTRGRMNRQEKRRERHESGETRADRDRNEPLLVTLVPSSLFLTARFVHPTFVPSLLTVTHSPLSLVSHSVPLSASGRNETRKRAK